MRDTGMRNERELFRLRIENLDRENRVIFVPVSKTTESPACVTPVVLAYSAFAYWIFRAKHLRTDGKYEHPAAPTSLVLGNLWSIAGCFRSFGDARPDCIEVDKLICC
jgi:hypothetical protein